MDFDDATLEVDEPLPKAGTTIKLRRPRPKSTATVVTNRSEVINKNLEPLRENIKKKKYAQTLWYKNHPEGVSPLIRQPKRPVHARLGLGNKSSHLVPLGTNTSSILPKKRVLRRFNNQNNTFSVQSRLNKFKPDTPRRIQLRRPHPLQGIDNLKVQVSNNSFNGMLQERQPTYTKRFKMFLDPRIQLDIKKIQDAYRGAPTVIEDFDIPVGATNMSLHYRFGSYA